MVLTETTVQFNNGIFTFKYQTCFQQKASHKGSNDNRKLSTTTTITTAATAPVEIAATAASGTTTTTTHILYKLIS